MNRRDFMLQFGAASLGSFGLSFACTGAPSREAILRGIVLEQVVPLSRLLHAKSDRLAVQAEGFVRTPTPEALDSLRATWKEALVLWKEAYALRTGPLLDTHALLRTMFWPARSQRLEELVASERRIDEQLIEEVGVDLKGLYAMEYLLFGAESTELLTRFKRTRRFGLLLEALARDVKNYADAATATLGDGSVFAARFAQDGQESLSLLVNQMAESVETVAQRFELVLALGARGRLGRESSEASLSGLSLEVSKALLRATEGFYVGGRTPGIGSLVKATSEPIYVRALSAFEQAKASVFAFNGSIEDVAREDAQALKAATEALKALEITLKVDVASALGVMLTFSMGDGD